MSSSCAARGNTQPCAPSSHRGGCRCICLYSFSRCPEDVGKGLCATNSSWPQRSRKMCSAATFCRHGEPSTPRQGEAAAPLKRQCSAELLCHHQGRSDCLTVRLQAAACYGAPVCRPGAVFLLGLAVSSLHGPVPGSGSCLCLMTRCDALGAHRGASLVPQVQAQTTGQAQCLPGSAAPAGRQMGMAAAPQRSVRSQHESVCTLHTK